MQQTVLVLHEVKEKKNQLKKQRKLSNPLLSLSPKGENSRKIKNKGRFSPWEKCDVWENISTALKKWTLLNVSKMYKQSLEKIATQGIWSILDYGGEPALWIYQGALRFTSFWGTPVANTGKNQKSRKEKFRSLFPCTNCIDRISLLL